MITDFEKEKVYWTRKMNLKLVKFIESKPNIWNPKHPKYTSVKFRDETYAEFASRYGGEFTGQAVKDRWTNIRSTFANYLRKVKASRTKPDSDEYKVIWPLWDACQFLLKVHKKDKDEIPISHSDIKDDKLKNDSPSSPKYCSSTRNSNDDSDVSDNNLHTSNSSSPKCHSIVSNLVRVFKGLQNDSFGINNTKHGRIGREVAKRLAQMSSYDAAQLSRKIFDILLLYDEHNPNNPNNFKL